MKIWQLTPLDTSHESWKVSAYQEQVCIRALSEEKAREIAACSFSKMTEIVFGQRVSVSPWYQSALVLALEIKNNDYPHSLEEEIVGPSEAREIALR